MAAVRPSRRAAISGWGRYPVLDCAILEPASAIEAQQPLPEGAIARGNGRSYGDSSLSPSATVFTRRLDRMLRFEPKSGILTCEAGVLLADIVALFVPRGWFPPVTPGTKFVTIGGMIAADVHGKNHHAVGSFCDHVRWIDLALGDGTVLRCSREEHSDLFAATCGGMGLTGLVLRAAFAMQPIANGWIEQEVKRAPNLRTVMQMFEASTGRTYSVAWIDCLAGGANLGRSVLFLGEHARTTVPQISRPQPRRRSRAVPIDFPALALNRPSVRAFNTLYYARQKPGTGLIDIDRYFYPLDALREWNRIYGARGFVQYQCVLPAETSAAGLAELLAASSRDGTPSFLAVLKLMGRSSFGHLSFPMPGYTLALDFPATEATMRLLDRFDAIVSAHGGRIYLAKDARVGRAAMQAGYPRLTEFREVRRRYGLDRRFRSAQSERLGL
ncbi:MAG: FAD-binding oxidoreductase [Acidisphaera sp.]|nr:FAD-binding oxidoreductase [Acidisphaera sp.]MBV9812949.1 FAD-binding oxidoreductase [Acetobacteraceae bacterium]